MDVDFSKLADAVNESMRFRLGDGTFPSDRLQAIMTASPDHYYALIEKAGSKAQLELVLSLVGRCGQLFLFSCSCALGAGRLLIAVG